MTDDLLKLGSKRRSIDGDIFNDIRGHLKKVDKETGSLDIVEKINNFGLKTSTIVKIFEEKKVLSRATVYNIMSNKTANIDKQTEDVLVYILKVCTVQGIKVEKNYRKHHRLVAVEKIVYAIREARAYFESLNEPSEIDFSDFDNKNEQNDFITNYIKYMED